MPRPPRRRGPRIPYPRLGAIDGGSADGGDRPAPESCEAARFSLRLFGLGGTVQRRIWLIGVVVVSVAAGMSLNGMAQSRTRSCPPGTPRDGQGYCLVAAPAPRPPASGSAPTKRGRGGSGRAGGGRGGATRACPVGQHVSGPGCCPTGLALMSGVCTCVVPALCGESVQTAPAGWDPRSCPASERDAAGLCVPPRVPQPPRDSRCAEGMVWIAGGAFWMGSPEGAGEDDERPMTRVTLDGFCLDRTEVTVAAYARCVSAGTCAAPETGDYFTSGVRGAEDHPVNGVSWDDATTYCRWAGVRLPTEAEWEYAARGTAGRAYPWGEQPPDGVRANVCGAECEWAAASEFRSRDAYRGTAPVGSFAAGTTVDGVADLAGNVWEWTSSRDGAYPGGSVTNPGGPSSGEVRVIRGGAFVASARAWVRGAIRLRSSASVRSSGVGFRCARGVPR